MFELMPLYPYYEKAFPWIVLFLTLRYLWNKRYQIRAYIKPRWAAFLRERSKIRPTRFRERTRNKFSGLRLPSPLPRLTNGTARFCEVQNLFKSFNKKRNRSKA